MIKLKPKQSRKKLGKRSAGKIGMVALGSLFILMGGGGAVWASQIPADTLSGGGSTSDSTSHVNQSSIAQAGVAGETSTSASGLQAQHGFWPMVSEVREAYLKGDVDGNGSVDIKDVLCLFRHVMGRSSCLDDPSSCISCADVDGNGSVDIKDVLCLFRHVMGRSSCMDGI